MEKVISTLYSLYTRLRTVLLDKMDPALLLFMVVMFNYRFSFKLIAIVGIYLYRPNFKIKLNGIVWFYLSMIFLGIINILFVHRNYSYNHVMTVLAGSLIWLTCLLSFHQISLAVAINSPAKLFNTLKLFAILNFCISVYDIIHVMFITGTINPYTQISPPPYGISSGDLVGGIFGKVHLVNTVISCFLLVFFIYQGSFLYALICLIPFLLTGSNLATIILIGMLAYILVFKKNMLIKYYAGYCIIITVLFYIKITPSNKAYMTSILTKVQKQFSKPIGVPVKPVSTNPEKPAKKLTKEELISRYIQYKKKLLIDSVLEDELTSRKLVFNSLYAKQERQLKEEKARLDFTWYKKDSLQLAKTKSEFFDYGKLKTFDFENEPGKITSFKQTKDYLLQSWQNALFGAGIGSFSSRLAFITSGIADDSRILKAIPRYQTNEFKENHKAIFKYLMFLDDETHSITNLPFSWYNGLFGEYGLIGFFIFVFAYMAYFFKRMSLLSFGQLLLVSMIAFFLFDYWYERLSVIMLFELLLLFDIKIKSSNQTLNE
jgi:hypothetical protein